ncbi:MAG: hypothetical protein V4612_07325 [Pseudomonadota bacterium]
MRKSKFIAIFAGCFLLQYNANCADMTDGAWKNLDEQYQQNIDNKNIISGMLNNRIYYTDTYHSDDRRNEYNDAFIKSVLGVNLRFSDHFIVKTNIKFDVMPQASENLRQSQLAKGEDRFFDNQGAFINELILNYNYKNFSALAGKFTADFGNAWRIENGIWVNELARQYRQSEKLGLGIIQRVGDEKTVGEYVFGLSAFTNDRKNLDNSIITTRDSAAKSDGTPGDTRNLDSYVLSTDIFYDFGNQEKLSYHFSYLNLAVNKRQNTIIASNKISDEKAFALNMKYEYPINNNFLLDSFVEYTNIINLDGDTDKGVDFLTVNFTAYIFKDFSITLAKAKEKQVKFGENGIDKSIEELSFGYKFDNLSPILKGLLFSVGYRQSELDDKINPITNKAFGFLIGHKIEF